MLADYRLNELREVYFEIFCTTNSSVDNPLLAPSGHGGHETFLVIEEGYLDNQEGHWVEDEEDGAEDFLEDDDDAFWVYDEESYSWFQRCFQGRGMKRGFKGRCKGKGKGGRESGGRRFFKKRKGRRQSRRLAEESCAAKGKGKKGKKGKGKGKYGKDGKGGSKDGAAQLADAARSSTPTTTATTFFVDYLNSFC